MPPKEREQDVVETLREFHPVDTTHWFDQYLKAYHNREKAAPGKGIRWGLSRRQFWDLVIAARGRCQVTGQPFDRYHKAKNGKRPFLPSLDRIDSNGGYAPGNIELTTIIANLAINDFGRDEFYSMVRHAAVSPQFGSYLDRTYGSIDLPRFLDNILPSIKNNPMARHLLKWFVEEGEIES